MSAAAAAVGPPGGEADPWSAVVRLAGVDYTVAMPEWCRPGSAEVEAEDFPEAVAPALLARLAVDLAGASRQGRTSAVWGALATLISDRRTRLEITDRIGMLGDPLTIEGLAAGMIEAVTLLAAKVKRPAAGATCTQVTIGGRTYAACVPEGMAALPAAVFSRARALPGPPVLGLLLFDEATLCELNDRVGDPGDPCTGEDVEHGVREALAALARPEAVRPVEAVVDDTLGGPGWEARRSPVVAEIGGLAYPVAYPRNWPRFIELVAGMGPLMYEREGVDRAVQLEGLAALVAEAVPMVFAPADVARIGVCVEDPRCDLDVVGAAAAMLCTLVALDTSTRGTSAIADQLAGMYASAAADGLERAAGGGEGP